MLIENEIDQYIKRKYENRENALVLPSFINVLRQHEKSNDKRVKNIIKNFKNLEMLLPNLCIRQSFYISNYSPDYELLNIKFKAEDMVIAHELGHIIAYATKIFDGEIDDNVKRLFIKAKDNCESEKNKSELERQIDYLTDEKNLKLKHEKQAISDILSAIFQSSIINLKDKHYWLKCGHEEKYYTDSYETKWDYVVGESFANYYALTLYNKTDEINLLRKLLGDEWINFMDGALSKSSQIIERPNLCREQTQEEREDR